MSFGADKIGISWGRVCSKGFGLRFIESDTDFARVIGRSGNMVEDLGWTRVALEAGIAASWEVACV